ncbi:MAG: methyltransferase [Oscillospiraceae bacterium]
MERKDFLRQGGPCFYFDTELFAPTTDSFALGWFAAPKRGERVCDLGSGTGPLGTLLLAREPSLTLFCVEQNAAANALAEKGFAENGWAERVTLRTGDLRENAALPAAGSMDYALSNPPYFPAGAARAPLARCGKPRGKRSAARSPMSVPRRRGCCAGADASRSSTGPSGYPTFLHAPRARAGAEAAALRSLLGGKRSLSGACGGAPRREGRSIG